MKLNAIVLGLALLLGQAGAAAAQSDSPEERARAIESYFQEVSMRDMMNDMVREVSKQLPPDQREPFETALLKNLRLDVVEAAAKQSLARHLTVAEINVFTEFIRRPEGKSAMAKMKYYIADLMPVVQQELERAVRQLQQPREQTKNNN